MTECEQGKFLAKAARVRVSAEAVYSLKEMRWGQLCIKALQCPRRPIGRRGQYKRAMQRLYSAQKLFLQGTVFEHGSLAIALLASPSHLFQTLRPL